MKTFHGGCLGCYAQNTNDISYCHGCKYFAPDWSKPDLSIRKLWVTSKQSVTSTKENKKIASVKKILGFDNIRMSYGNVGEYNIFFKHYYIKITRTGIWLNSNFYSNSDEDIFKSVKKKFNDVSNFENDILIEERDKKLGKIL